MVGDRTRGFVRSGPVRVLSQWQEFHRLGLDRRTALDWARSKTKSEALDQTCFCLLPAGALTSLRVIVDVGAGEGSWLDAVTRLIDPQLVIAVESDPLRASSLRERLGAGPTRRIHDVSVDGVSHAADLRQQGTGDPSLPVAAPQPSDGGVSLDALMLGVDQVSVLRIGVRRGIGPILAGATATLAMTRFVLTTVTFLDPERASPNFGEVQRSLVQSGFVLRNLAPLRTDRNLVVWSDALFESPPRSAAT
jgi:hypothetical protein